MTVSAILLLAGLSTRFDAPKSKQVCLLSNKPVFSYALETLAKNKEISNLVVVVNEKIKAEIEDYIVKNNIVAKIVLGGETRQQSVSNGLKKCVGDIVVIHDGARPLIDDSIIIDVINAANEFGASTAFIPETDTVVEMKEGKLVNEFLKREVVAKIQTPQAFKLELIREAHKKANSVEATDDCSLVKALGHDVKLVLGSKKLTKITTIEDIRFLEGLLK